MNTDTHWVNLLPPATKLGLGNIFRSVCQEFCPKGGHAWGVVCGRGACVAGGCMAGGVCMAGGMCGGGGHAWGWCMAGGGMHGRGRHAWQILRNTVNERAVCILLECILVGLCVCLGVGQCKHTIWTFGY